MILGYLLFAVVAASFSSVLALVLGASVWLAFGVYTLVGTFTLVTLPLTAMLIGAYSEQNKTLRPRDVLERRGTSDLTKESVDRA